MLTKVNDIAKNVVGPDGKHLLEMKQTTLTPTEVAMLREYKKFLLKYRLRESLRCQDCFEANRDDGFQFGVNDERMFAHCRCRILTGT